MSDFQKPDDLALVPTLMALAPAEAEAFLGLHHSAERADGSIPRKYRELIALGVALTTQCSYCLAVHTRAARENGVTKEELAEAAFIAANVRAGGTVAHSLMALRFFDKSPLPD